MDTHVCKNIVISCIDYRIQELIHPWIHSKFPHEQFDYAAFAGSVKNIQFAEKQIGISYNLHKIKQVILIEHEDCGAYKDIENPREQQLIDLKKAKENILKHFPNLKINLFYLSVSGVFEEV